MERKSILKGLKAGDKYDVFTAPEEFHYWTRKKGWEETDLKRYRVKFAKIFFRGSMTIDLQKEKWLKESPKLFNNGTIDRGCTHVFSQTDISFSILISDFLKMNLLLKEVCEMYNIPKLRVESIIVENLETESFLYFERFNPDSLGISLYCRQINEKMYTDFKYFQQKIGKFQGIKASCRLSEKPSELVPECAFHSKY